MPRTVRREERLVERLEPSPMFDDAVVPFGVLPAQQRSDVDLKFDSLERVASAFAVTLGEPVDRHASGVFVVARTQRQHGGRGPRSHEATGTVRRGGFASPGAL